MMTAYSVSVALTSALWPVRNSSPSYATLTSYAVGYLHEGHEN